MKKRIALLFTLVFVFALILSTSALAITSAPGYRIPTPAGFHVFDPATYSITSIIDEYDTYPDYPLAYYQDTAAYQFGLLPNVPAKQLLTTNDGNMRSMDGFIRNANDTHLYISTLYDDGDPNYQLKQNFITVFVENGAEVEVVLSNGNWLYRNNTFEESRLTSYKRSTGVTLGGRSGTRLFFQVDRAAFGGSLAEVFITVRPASATAPVYYMLWCGTPAYTMTSTTYTGWAHTLNHPTTTSAVTRIDFSSSALQNRQFPALSWIDTIQLVKNNEYNSGSVNSKLVEFKEGSKTYYNTLRESDGWKYTFTTGYYKQPVRRPWDFRTKITWKSGLTGLDRLYQLGFLIDLDYVSAWGS